MKKLITIVLLTILTACNERSNETIDGCEYINSKSWNGHGYTELLTHKGNCKNPAHKNYKNTDEYKEQLLEDSLLKHN